ncbi:O-antigen ligase family protein [bacterium]|nr:O-antigen ligase family protein [bacterium]
MVGDLKFGILWKLVFCGFMLSKFILEHESHRPKKHIVYGFLLNFKQFFTLSSLTSISPTLKKISTGVSFPLLLLYFSCFYSKKKSLLLMKTIAVYVIVSSIPFLLGVVEPIARGYDLSTYGLDSYGFIGVFQRAHTASMVLAPSIIIVLYTLKHADSNLHKILYFSLILIGFYALIQTFVRTGLVMVLFGAFILYFQKIKSMRMLKRILFAGILLSTMFIYYQSNEVAQMRVQGRNIYNQDRVIEFDNIGSGRLRIASYALNNWVEEGFSSICFGLGEELALEKMERTKGTRVFAHNGVVEILQTNGIFGFSLLCLFLFSMHQYVKRNKNSKYYILYQSLFFSYLIGFILQGTDNFVLYFYIALIVTITCRDKSKVRKTGEEKQNIKNHELFIPKNSKQIPISSNFKD